MTQPGFRTKALAAVFAIAGSCSIAQADGTKQQPDKLSDLLTGSGLQINLSWFSDLLAHKSYGGYNLSYKDTKLFSGGNLVTAPDIQLSDDPIKFGDSPVSVAFQDGAGTLGGTLFSTVGVAPINLNFGPPNSLRILAGLDGSVFNQGSTSGVNKYVGVEWLPFGTFDKGSEHFLGISARYEDLSATAPASEQTQAGTVAARGRFGSTIGMKLSDQRKTQIKDEIKSRLRYQALVGDSVHLTAATIKVSQVFREKRGVPTQALERSLNDSFMEQYKVAEPQPGLLDAEAISLRQAHQLASKSLTDLIAQRTAEPSSRQTMAELEAELRQKVAAVDHAFAALPQSMRPQANFTEAVRSQLFTQNLARAVDRTVDDAVEKSSPNNPTLAYYVEFDGSYAFNKVPDPRARGVYTLNLRYNFDSSKADTQYILVSFEYGKTRAQPTVPVSSVSVLFNYKF